MVSRFIESIDKLYLASSIGGRELPRLEFKHYYLKNSQPIHETRGGVEDTRLEAKAKDIKKIRGQGQGQPFRGQTLSRPRTGMFEAKDQGHKRKRSPKKKRSSQKFCRRSPQKNVFQKIFQAFHKLLTIQKIVLSSSRGQANFRGLETSRPRPRTSKCVLEDVLEAKDVLEDSTSAWNFVTLRIELEKPKNGTVMKLFLLRIRTTYTEILDREKIINVWNFINCWWLTRIRAVMIAMINHIPYGLNLPNTVSITWSMSSLGLEQGC